MNKIFVYSGTGNSYASAKQLGTLLNAEIMHIQAEACGEFQTHKGAVAVLIFPVYAYGLPKLVKKFIQTNNFKFEYIAVLATMGTKHGGALAEAIKLFKRQGQKVQYSAGIKAVENYVHTFGWPKEEQIVELCKNQKTITNDIAQDITERKENKRRLFRPDSAIASVVFKNAINIFARRYKVLDTCTGCRICYQICPPQAIEMSPAVG